MSFIEENEMDAKYIEFAQKVLEKIENDYIVNTKYEEKLTGEEIEEKTKKIKETLSKINNDIK